RGAGSERGPDVRPEAPELVQGLLSPHAGQVGEEHERLAAELRLHLQQGVARLLGCAYNPGLARDALLEREGRAARQRWGAAVDVRPGQLREFVVAGPRRAERLPG